jgi:hypothetical protein
MHRSPSLERFGVSGFPVGEFRKDLDARFDFKTKSSLVLKTDVNNVVIRLDGQFHFGNDLAFCLLQLENPLVCFLSSVGAGTLRDSHRSPFYRR